MSLTVNETKLYEEEDIALAVEGVIIPLVAFFGLIGNILSIIVLWSKGINMKVRRNNFPVTFSRTKHS